jgi:protein ImuA
MIPAAGDRREILNSLRRLCRSPAEAVLLEPSRLSTGIPALDRLLPGGGLECGSLVEWLVPVRGSGAAVLALQGVRAALDKHRVWAVVDATGEFYPLAAQGWGVPLASLLLLRPASAAEIAWTVEQCLRCPAVGTTWIDVEQLNDRILQRWKVAAEAGGGVGVLFRPARQQRRSSFADVRWLVQPRPDASAAGRRVRIELLKCRGKFAGGAIDLDVNDATGNVHLVSAVGHPTTAFRATGA